MIDALVGRPANVLMPRKATKKLVRNAVHPESNAKHSCLESEQFVLVVSALCLIMGFNFVLFVVVIAYCV